MADCSQSCPIANKVDRLEAQLDELQAQNGDSHREIYGRLNTLERASDVQGAHYDAIMEKLDSLARKVDGLERKPAKRWDAAVTALIGAVVGAVAAYLMAGAGLG